MNDNVINDGFLVTKLYLPALRSDRVVRQHLLTRLRQGLHTKLTLICTPAGFGKTTLLSEWLHFLKEGCSDESVIAWIALDRGDNDPAHFWSYVLRASEILPESILSTFTYSTDAIKQTLTVLINKISQHSGQFILVLDDYHTISEPQIHDGMLFLLDHSPPNMHLVIASRTNIPFPLARLRSQQQVVELYAEHLRFTQEETTSYLRDKNSIRLTDKDISDLEQHTEGWIAGLQLLALAARDRKDISTFFQNFVGDHRYIFDYLSEEVLTRLSEEVQAFLLATSILSSMCAPLCDAITGQCDSQKMLEQLEQANVFLVPLDDKRCWYRYHHLFAEALFHRLQQTQASLLPELHRRAYTWYEQNGQNDKAIEHALMVGDFEKVAYLLESIGETLLRQGEMMSLENWLKQVPEATIQAHPALQMLLFWVLTSHELWKEAEICLQGLERNLMSSSKTQKFTVGLKVGHSFLAQNKGNFALSILLVRQALDLLSPDDYGQRCYMQLHLAKVYWLHGNLTEAKQAILEGLRVSEQGGYKYFVVLARLELAHLQTIQGQLAVALNTYRQALQMIEECKGSAVLLASAIHAGLGIILYEQNNLNAALQHIEESIRLSQEVGDIHTLIHSRVLLAHNKLAMGNLESAYEAIQYGKCISPSPDTFFPFTSFIEYYVRIFIATGDREQAADVLEKHNAIFLSPLLKDQAQLARAMLLRSNNQYANAIALLESIYQRAEARGDKKNTMNILILQALLYQAQNNTLLAISALVHALSLAESSGFMRPFLNEGEPMKALLIKTCEALRDESQNFSYSVSPAYIQQLLTSFEKFPEQQDKSSAIQLHAKRDKLLSERELEVLRLIALGKSNQDIAEHLVIANSTLKTHINRMYGKLAVRSRTQALIKAKELNLL